MDYIEQGIKVGDRVFVIQGPECEVGETNAVVTLVTTDSMIRVQTDAGTARIYTRSGRYLIIHDALPSLYWTRPHIDIPPKPEPDYNELVGGWVMVREGVGRWAGWQRRWLVQYLSPAHYPRVKWRFECLGSSATPELATGTTVWPYCRPCTPEELEG